MRSCPLDRLKVDVWEVRPDLDSCCQVKQKKVAKSVACKWRDMICNRNYTLAKKDRWRSLENLVEFDATVKDKFGHIFLEFLFKKNSKRTFIFCFDFLNFSSVTSQSRWYKQCYQRVLSLWKSIRKLNNNKCIVSCVRLRSYFAREWRDENQM